MLKGEIYITRFPLGGTVGVKNRPTLLLAGPTGSVPEYLTAYISTAIPDPLLPSDLILDPSTPEHASTNLKLRSVIRLHKLSTVHQRDIFRRLGDVAPAVWLEVEAKLRNYLGL